MKPVRIQRKRTRGWKMPENTVYVGRPTIWGNPYRVGKDGTAEECVKKFEGLITPMVKRTAEIKLKGKNLACFCPLNKPCHADVLLKIANS